MREFPLGGVVVGLVLSGRVERHGVERYRKEACHQLAITNLRRGERRQGRGRRIGARGLVEGK
jgi:hypothetical protein